MFDAECATKTELDAELARLDALRVKIATLPGLDDAERETLEDGLDGRSARVREGWKRLRLERAIDLLFPEFAGHRPEDQQPVRWPGCRWWNGASIKAAQELASGDFQVSLSSYVGGGDYDEMESFVVKREWLEADDQAAVIHAACRVEAQRLEEKARAAERTSAQANLEAARARLAELDASTRNRCS